ncbi:MAG: MFS transporter [Clostridia bacterium]|nr:MFS transporter [Clostridia bacterium]
MSKKTSSDKKFAKRAAALGANLKRFWKEPPKGRFLNLKEILRFGVSGLGMSFIANLVSIYVTVSQIPLLYDLGDYGPVHAQVMYIVASVLALIITPIYGRMIQRTKTKIGRYKPYILCLAPIVAILGAASVWSPQSLNQTQRIIYVYMLCTPTILLWNLWYNSFNMFPGVITPNQQERADVWAPIGLVIGFAPTVMNALKGVFIKWGGGDVGAARIYAVFCAVVGIALATALIGVKERVFVTQEEKKKEKISTIEGLKMIVKNKPLMIFTLALCLGCFKGTIDLSWEVIARVKYATNMADAAALFGGLSLVVGFATTPNMILLPWMTRKFNNRTILIFWQACNVSANLICALIGLQNFPQGSWSPYVITIIRFVSLFNALGSLQPLLLSEISDLQQAKSGYRLEGFVQTFAYQLTLVVGQLAALVPAFIQTKMGFNPSNYKVVEGTDNILSPELIKIAENYGNVALWMSAISGILMLICLLFYNLNKKKHAEVVAQLKANAVNAEEIAQEQGSLNMLENVVDGTKEEKIAESEENVDTLLEETLTEETAIEETTDIVPPELGKEDEESQEEGKEDFSDKD